MLNPWSDKQSCPQWKTEGSNIIPSETVLCSSRDFLLHCNTFCEEVGTLQVILSLHRITIILNMTPIWAEHAWQSTLLTVANRSIQNLLTGSVKDTLLWRFLILYVIVKIFVTKLFPNWQKQGKNTFENFRERYFNLPVSRNHKNPIPIYLQPIPNQIDLSKLDNNKNFW